MIAQAIWRDGKRYGALGGFSSLSIDSPGIRSFVLTSLLLFAKSSEELVPRHTRHCLHCQVEGMLVGRRGQLTCYYKVVQLVALSVEVFFHSRDVGISDVLLTEKLGKPGQCLILQRESHRVIHTRQKTALICVSCYVLNVQGFQLCSQLRQPKTRIAKSSFRSNLFSSAG
jgi:hypothetical protein